MEACWIHSAGTFTPFPTFSSPFYAAPEMILGKKYEGPEVDMWSLGVILFALLCGHLPFDDDNVKELYKKIATGSFVCPDYLMPNARHLITRLITVDPKERATLQEVLDSKWVNEGYDHSPKNHVPERPVIIGVEKLSKELVSRILAFGYTIEDVEKAFSFDADQSKPSPVRSTYFLLLEMHQREEKAKLERKAQLKKVSSSKSLSLLGDSSSSIGALGRIDEASILSSTEEVRAHESSIKKTARRPWSSVHTLIPIIGPRRSSAPDPAKRKSSDPAIGNTDRVAEHPRPYTASPRKSVAEMNTARTSGDQGRRGSKETKVTKVKDELRAVSGWFLNVSTTSNKAPVDIITEVSRVLTLNAVPFSVKEFTVICKLDKGIDVECGKGSLGFQIEVCKVPKMSNLHGLNFKRISGGVWNYKKVCNKILSQMVL
jgi:serine/threonine protein kinase